MANEEQLTTFGGRGMETSIPRAWWKCYRPLYPTPAVDEQIQVRLLDNMKLPKQSYINVWNALLVPISVLEPLNHEGLSPIPRLGLYSFIVIAEKLDLKLELGTRHVKELLETQKVAQTAQAQKTRKAPTQIGKPTALPKPAFLARVLLFTSHWFSYALCVVLTLAIQRVLVLAMRGISYLQCAGSA